MSIVQSWHVCGLILQVKPVNLLSIIKKLTKIPYTEIPVFDAIAGKVVVILQSENEQFLLQHIENIQKIKGVITVSLVYHQQDVGESSR